MYIHFFCELQVPGKWFEYVLPGTDGVRATDYNWFTFFECTNAVGDYSVNLPITTTENIASASCCKTFTVKGKCIRVEK